MILRDFNNEDDYWRIRNFLREVFLLNDRLEPDTHVANLDHWRWHYILTCRETEPVEQVTNLWETEDGKIAAVLHPICHDEARLHVHPHFRTPALEDEMLALAEEKHFDWTVDGKRIFYLPIFEHDTLRRELLIQRGYEKLQRWEHHWWRDLDAPILEAAVPPGYVVRSMGALDEHPARSWASWRAFHAEEPDENYHGDCSWYQNMQSAPLYRRDLDIVAATTGGEIAAFCTISYDDYTRSAVCVLVGTAAEHLQRGLDKAVMLEGMQRLQKLGCTRLFASTNDPLEDALYRSLMQNMQVAEIWRKIWS